MSISIRTKELYLPLLALSVFGLLCVCCSRAPVENLPKQPLGPPDRVDIVYFQQGIPCHCIAVVGETIQGTVLFYFQDELSSGKLTFQIVDLDDKESAAIARKYNAAPFSLYINMVRGDIEHIVSVPEIWASTGLGRDDLMEFVKSKIEKSLAGDESGQ